MEGSAGPQEELELETLEPNRWGERIIFPNKAVLFSKEGPRKLLGRHEKNKNKNK